MTHQTKPDSLSLFVRNKFGLAHPRSLPDARLDGDSVRDRQAGTGMMATRKALQTKAKIAFIEFLRPDCYWPHPYSIEQAFEVFRWMVCTGLAYERPTRWGRNGPLEALSLSPSCTNFSAVSPIESLDDLRARFHHALLTKHNSTTGLDEWREAFDIRCDGSHVITFPHHKPFSGGAKWQCEAAVKDAADKLFRDGSSLRTKRSLNEYHPTARTCKSVTVAVYHDGFHFVLEFGWLDEECTSNWFHDLAATRRGEPFLATMARAIDALDELTEPPIVPDCRRDLLRAESQA